MYVDKIISIRLTLTDVNDIYKKNSTNHLLQIVRNKYTKKIFQNCFIDYIESIKERSFCSIDRKNLSAPVNVNVKFEARCIIPSQYEVINGMKIIAIDDIRNCIICENDVYLTYIQRNSKLELLKIDDVIPVRIGTTRMTPLNEKITMSAFPFVPLIPSFDTKIYNISKIENNEYQILENMINKIKNELTKQSKYDKKKLEYLKKMFYPFRDTKQSKNKQVDMLDVKNFNKNNNLSFDISNEAYDGKLTIHSENVCVETANSVDIYNIWLTEYYKYIVAINEMYELYNSDFKKYEHIFNIYTSHKK